MRFLPTLRFGLANHWILLILYGAALMFSVLRLPKEKRDWLFEDPKENLRGTRKLILRLGQLIAVLFLVAVSFTPLLDVPAWLAVIGLAFFAAGTALMVVSIHYFGRSAEGEATIDGPYRFSRNPQWVGLFSVLLGLAISSGSWLLVLAVLGVGASYHIQIIEEEKLCQAKYGLPYKKYLDSVARYLLVKRRSGCLTTR
jgi:protein-S-isoprenylcysteine O-methyltransferase Ste14